MGRRTQHFSVGIGDLTRNGSDRAEWQRLIEHVAPLAAQTPVIPIVGNHDYDGFYDDLESRHYLNLFRPVTHESWFAWSCGAARLVALDLNREFPLGISPGSPQYRWLEDELRSAAWRDATWRVLLVHQPPWSRTWKGYDGDLATRRLLERMNTSRHVAVVLAGHSHAYESLPRRVRGRPVRILITGGAGGSLEAPRPDALLGDGDRYAVRHHFLHIEATADRFVADAMGLDGRPFDRTVLRR